MSPKLRKYLTILSLGLAGGSIYFLPYIRNVFYDAQITSMGISNTQSGMLLTMYTIGNMILYIPGGILADKVSPKKALVVSLISTALLTYVYAFTMNYAVSLVIWLGLSFSTAFVFWSSLMKAVRIIGTEEEQGFLGIEGVDVTSDSAQMYGMPEGVYVSGVIKGGGAEKAGITKGSVITGLNGTTIDSMTTLQEQLQYYAAGTKVKLTLQVPGSGGNYKEQTVEVTLGKNTQ